MAASNAVLSNVDPVTSPAAFVIGLVNTALSALPPMSIVALPIAPMSPDFNTLK